MIEKSWTVNHPGELPQVARELLAFAGNHRLFLLHGEMGAGKTTFVRACCSVLEVEDNVNSPTFSIVQEYRTQKGDPVYHFDLYRIRREAELYDLGAEQYLDQQCYCFVEWPEKAPGLFSQPKADIFITAENNCRVIRCIYE